MELDLRLLRVGVEIEGQLKTYDQRFGITVAGTKYADPTQNECEVKIANLDKATRDYLLTASSPFALNKGRKILRVEAGRVSSGYALVYLGDITNSTGGQPPDITISLKSATQDYAKGKILANSQPVTTPLRNIAAQVAKDLGLLLTFEATNKSVQNYSFTGAAIKQVKLLGDMARVNAYVDDGALIVKDWNVPLLNRIREVNVDTGMIGVPEFTETGLKVRMLFDTQTVLGGMLRLRSKLNPAADGDYTIAKLGFELASRDDPFYQIAEAVRVDQLVKTQRKK